MKNISPLLIAALASTLFFFAFKPNPAAGMRKADTPGVIKAIGKTQSEHEFIFERWQFTEAEMQDDKVENIKLEAEIDCTSLTGEWDDLVKSIKKKKDYFYIAEFPTAKVMVDGAVDQGDGTWLTNARVTIKKFTKEVPLTFTISDTKPYEVVGQGMIKRKKFGFTGGGPENEVPVSFQATLPFE